jgi:hypothetical protein
MVLVRETVTGDWQALRDIRLEALRDAPVSRRLVPYCQNRA